MAKPIGPICNYDCRYCFYLEKEGWLRPEPSWRMTDAVLEEFVRQYIEAQQVPGVTFAWQGGEPTLCGIDFFRKATALQGRFANGKTVTNALQTNGSLLDDEWCEFLAKNGFLVGLSIDGPRELHDAFRIDRQGRPTFDDVMKGIGLLKKHGVEFNTLTVVHRLNSNQPREVYRFLKEIGSQFHQYIPVVERVATGPFEHEGKTVPLSLAPPPAAPDDDAPLAGWSVTPAGYGDFLIGIYDEWVRNDVGEIFVQAFDVALSNRMGLPGALCVSADTCGLALAIEHNGDVYSCDHYVYPRYRLGNLMEKPLAEMVASKEQSRFGKAKSDTLPLICRECDVLINCRGGCPKHRFRRSPHGEPGWNYLCEGYRRFYRHIDPTMRIMEDLLRAGRPPADVMTIILNDPPSAMKRMNKSGRNDPCPCGSGRKYKKCCIGELR